MKWFGENKNNSTSTITQMDNCDTKKIFVNRDGRDGLKTKRTKLKLLKSHRLNGNEVLSD